MTTQCPNCQRGLPVTETGYHHTDREVIECTNARHPLQFEPKERDAWYQPGKRVRNRGPFECGGGL